MFSATILTRPLCVSPLHCNTWFRVLTCPGRDWLATVTFYGYPIFCGDAVSCYNPQFTSLCVPATLLHKYQGIHMSRIRMISYSHILRISHFFHWMMFSATILTKPLCVSPLDCYTRFKVPSWPGQGWLATVTFYRYPIFFRGMLCSVRILTIPLCMSLLHCYTRFRVPSWLATVSFYGYVKKKSRGCCLSATLLT